MMKSKPKGKKKGSVATTTVVPLQSGASPKTGSTTKNRAAIDTSAHIATATMDDTIARTPPTAAIAKAIVGTPTTTIIANNTTTGTDVAATMTEGSSIDTSAAIATTTDVTTKDTTIDTSANQSAYHG